MIENTGIVIEKKTIKTKITEITIEVNTTETIMTATNKDLNQIPGNNSHTIVIITMAVKANTPLRKIKETIKTIVIETETTRIEKEIEIEIIEIPETTETDKVLLMPTLLLLLVVVVIIKIIIVVIVIIIAVVVVVIIMEVTIRVRVAY
mmetsp:Transcript_485/g.88  ORF Transcript_485/g.88 Transcript_485/m.88 type:complete len:149 (-) Transcript_485:30-476(-)